MMTPHRCEKHLQAYSFILELAAADDVPQWVTDRANYILTPPSLPLEPSFPSSQFAEPVAEERE